MTIELQRTGAVRAVKPLALTSRRRNRTIMGVVAMSAALGLGVVGLAQSGNAGAASAAELPSLEQISADNAQSFNMSITEAAAGDDRNEQVQATLEPEPSPVTTSSSSSSSSSSNSSGSSSLPTGGSYDAGSVQAIAQGMMSSDEFGCFDYIISRESGWNPYAQNSSSGAYGLAQALPGSKMASAGSDWATNPETQIRWAVGYMEGRYGSICGAYSFWQANSWY